MGKSLLAGKRFGRQFKRMTRSLKTMVSLVAATNILIALLLLREGWIFHKQFDRPGWLGAATDIQKTRMLRTIYYWGVPPIALLNITSGILLWKMRKEKMALP